MQNGPGFLTALIHAISLTWWWKTSCWVQKSFQRLLDADHVLIASYKVMSIISSITTYFLHSNYATHHLKEELKKEKDKQGIEVAGVTRFSSFSIHARSISWCLYPMQQCLVSGTVKFNTAAVSNWFWNWRLCWRSSDRWKLFGNTSYQDLTVSNFS